MPKSIEDQLFDQYFGEEDMSDQFGACPQCDVALDCDHICPYCKTGYEPQQACWDDEAENDARYYPTG